MAENTETAKKEEAYVSKQLAVKTWSVTARDLHEGGSIVILHKAWDSQASEFIVFPSYSGQDPAALRPDVWMSWRHELKPPMAGHTRIRDSAEVLDVIPITSAASIDDILHEQTLNRVEALRRFHDGQPGLVALVVRVYHLSRTYKFNNVAENEGDGQFVALPFEVDLSGRTPAVDDESFERRRAAVKASLGA